jgi:anaerobic selenocysteine-containing dehydrogenase
LGESKSNVDFFRELALRMGFEDDCFRDSVDQLIDTALSSGVPQLRGITRNRLEKDPHVRLNLNGDGDGEPWLPFANGFVTANGKARLYNEELIGHGMDPVASFVAPQESRHSAAAGRYPLELLARKADNFLNSTFVNLPTHQKMEPHQQKLEMASEDAKSRRIVDGDRVRVFNDRGEIFLHATVNGSVRAGVVGARLGWAKLADNGININVLTSDRLTDLGGGATFYSTLVEVERADHRPCVADDHACARPPATSRDSKG